jgi:putative glutamine amidotransferase
MMGYMSPDGAPLIAVSACLKTVGGHPIHSVGEKYLTAVSVGAGGTPMIVPALGADLDIAAILRRVDGLVLTGSLSNVHPSRYGAEPHPAAEPYDEARDATTFPLIEGALELGVPLLAICRGFQELNVALGGTLHAEVHAVPGREDHRAPQVEDLDERYGPRHPVRFVPGGAFEAIAGAGEVWVNSLHRQGIDTLAPRLAAEGHAPDGTVEAVRVTDAPAFALGVQWHPEYKAAANPFSMKLYRAFGEAARAYARMR